MLARLYHALGANTDERITNLVALVLAAFLPMLIAGAAGWLS